MHVSELDTPAIVADLDVVEANIREMAAYCSEHGLRLRPHTKTHKIPDLARMQVRAGAGGITVAKLGEAELMAASGFEDILIAYPIVGEAKLRRLARLAEKASITVSTDSAEVALGIARACADSGTTVRLLAEMDAGLRRCGVPGPKELASLGAQMSCLPAVLFAGFMFFPGHIRVPPEEQGPTLTEIDARLADARERLAGLGIEVDVVSGGSTPTACRSHLMKTVTEIRPGTYIFNDMNTARIGAAELERCALTVHTTVVSLAVPGRAVIDGGSKTFSSDPLRAGDGRGFGYVVDHPEAVLESMSEEHGHLNIERASRPLRIGERLRLIPNHVCATVNLHDELWGVRNDEVKEHWKVEGRGLVR